MSWYLENRYWIESNHLDSIFIYLLFIVGIGVAIYLTMKYKENDKNDTR